MSAPELYYDRCPVHLGGAEDSVTCAFCCEQDAAANWQRRLGERRLRDAVARTVADMCLAAYANAVAGGR